MSLNHSTQSGQHPYAARDADLYETPGVALKRCCGSSDYHIRFGSRAPLVAPSPMCCAIAGMR